MPVLGGKAEVLVPTSPVLMEWAHSIRAQVTPLVLAHSSQWPVVLMLGVPVMVVVEVVCAGHWEWLGDPVCLMAGLKSPKPVELSQTTCQQLPPDVPTALHHSLGAPSFVHPSGPAYPPSVLRPP